MTALSRTSHSTSSTPNLTWLQGDITRLDSLKPVSDLSYDVLFHLAGLVTFDNQNRSELYEVNEIGCANICQLALRLKIPRFVLVSSAATIGPKPNQELANESTPLLQDPQLHPYSHSKLRGEEIVQEYVKKGLPAVIVNPTFVFGEDDDHTPAMQLLRKLKYRKIPFYPPGGLCIVWVGDVVTGIISAAKNGRLGERYILGGENISNREAYRDMATAVGGLIPRFPLPKQFLYLYGYLRKLQASVTNTPSRYPLAWARDAGRYFFYSSEKAKDHLNYLPQGFLPTLEKTSQALMSQNIL